MKKKIIIVFILLIAIAIPISNNYQAFAHGGEDHGDEKKQTSGNSLSDEVEVLKETQFLFDIQTTTSSYTDYYNKLKLYGKIMPAINGSAQIIAPQNGFVISLNVGIGESVGKGQVMAVIEQNLNASEQIQISTEKSNADAEYEAAKKEFERLKSIEDIISKKDFQQAQIRYNTAAVNKKVYDNLTSNNSKLITIKSPIDGVVDNFNLAIGQQVKQGDNIFNVFDIKKLKVEAQIFDKDMGKITKDVKFFVECVQQNHATESARLVAFGNVVNPVNQSSQVILEIDNSQGMFKPGQFVNVDVMAQSENKKLVVPTSAITDINGKSVVFIHHEPEVFKVVYVQLGESNSETTVILNGLKENERVVTSGTYQIKSVFMNQ
ncbi:MAG: efflux RND transporter periplasmic adaptor subunit [Bacteroidota bacterium]|nr:efflux RND transporter periplasmic adaptor subunit [Bacteroidota bacterium]MDP3147354.1 efflux RND transporter periplasmic adaptor subunit [Bacteroidota bacterium]